MKYNLKALLNALRPNWSLVIVWVTTFIFYFFDSNLFSHLANGYLQSLILIWLFSSILIAAFSTLKQAEFLSVHFGHTKGMLILTLAVTSIEAIMITSIIYTSPYETSPIARDTLFSVIMIMLNCMVGLTLLLGALRYREQTYNLSGVHAFLAAIIPLAVLILIMPNYTKTTENQSFDVHQTIMVSIMAFVIYGIFLSIQMYRHKDFFADITIRKAERITHRKSKLPHSIYQHIILLLAFLIPMIVLAKKFSIPFEYLIQEVGAPVELRGLIVAILILSPESYEAIRDALSNKLQQAINILMGSTLASISLTIPAVMIFCVLTNRYIILGLNPANIRLLWLTLFMCILTFSTRRSNVLFGTIHLFLFFIYIMLLFWP